MIESLEQRILLAITPVPFQHFTIDNNPGATPLEKTLADIDGDGNLDAIVGFNNQGGPGGIVWYQYPHSGNPADKWNRYTIAAPGGQAYEDMVAYDLEGNGVEDIIASYNSQIVWFENPRNTGGDPTKGPWTMHVIGPDAGHELALGDFDGDGKIDIATRMHIYFQNSPTSWTTISTADYGDHVEVGCALFDSGSGLGSVDLIGTSTNGLQLGWYENPRDHGGNARTDPWIFHAIAPNYSTDTSIGISFASTDVNGDGMDDIITCDGESGDLPGPPPGGMIWWQAPTDRINGTWIPHTIDATLQDVHKIDLADMNNDGHLDIVFSEQEQSAQDRVGIIYNVDGTGNNWQMQVLSTVSGHNQFVGDINGDGAMDILNIPHGLYTGYNPVEIYMSQLKGVTSNVPAGWNDSDIGGPGLPGSANSSDGVNWTVTGGGADIGGTSDQFNYVSADVGAASTIIAEVTQLTWTNTSAEDGLMFRASSDPGSPFADVSVTPSAGLIFQWRSAANGSASSTTVANQKVPVWLKLVRSGGNTFTAFYSTNGTTWTQIGASQTITMPTTALGGIAVTANNNGMLNTGVFSGFSMSGGIAEGASDLAAPVYVSDLTPTFSQNGWGPFENDRSNGETGAADGHTITLNGQVYSKGLGTNAASDIRYNLAGGNYADFRADVGVDDEVGSNGTVDFQVWLDSNKVFDSGVMTSSSATQHVDVPINGASTLRLVVTNGGDNNNYDHGDWANARLIKLGYAGDVNLDGRVDVSDLYILAQHYNTSGNSWSTGDLNHDGLVNLADLKLLAQSWGDGVNGSATSLAPLLTGLGLPQTSAPQPVVVPPSRTVYLSDLPITINSNGWGPAELDHSNGETGAHDGHTITLNGVQYAKGLGVHADSEIDVALNGAYTQFTSDIGVDDEVGSNGHVDFQVWLDGIKAFDSGTMTGISSTKTLNLDVTGVHDMKLIVNQVGPNNNFDHADWAGARLET